MTSKFFLFAITSLLATNAMADIEHACQEQLIEAGAAAISKQYPDAVLHLSHASVVEERTDYGVRVQIPGKGANYVANYRMEDDCASAKLTSVSSFSLQGGYGVPE